MQRLFKQGVSKVVKERAEEMDQLARKGSLYVMDAFAGRSVKPMLLVIVLLLCYPPFPSFHSCMHPSALLFVPSVLLFLLMSVYFLMCCVVFVI